MKHFRFASWVVAVRMVLMVWTVLAALPAEAVDKEKAEREKWIQTLAERYRAAKTDEARLAVAIRAVDLELIGISTSVDVVDRLFGTDLMEKARDPEGTRLGRVVLGKRADGGGEETGAVYVPLFTGWKLWVAFDRYGIIQRYWLSKESKP
ncbi:MAG: hypothetical protein JNK60_21325 [Acidobacteria bacterium]|nr:hypothetical protein [Acidobacteriota bacterium]